VIKRCGFVVLVCLVAASASGEDSLKAGNVSKYLGKDSWEWTIFVTGPDSVLRQISSVQYSLHPTFTPSLVTVSAMGDPKMPFRLTRVGWGVFTVGIQVVFRDGRTTRLSHMLSFVPAATPPCLPDITLDEEHYRMLQDERFGDAVYVYVGDVKSLNQGRSARPAAHVTLFSADPGKWSNTGELKQTAFDARAKTQIAQRWDLDVRTGTESLQFDYRGRAYVVSVVRAQARLGHDLIVLRVCEKQPGL
jgi:hypothetical protein